MSNQFYCSLYFPLNPIIPRQKDQHQSNEHQQMNRSTFKRWESHIAYSKTNTRRKIDICFYVSSRHETSRLQGMGYLHRKRKSIRESTIWVKQKKDREFRKLVISVIRNYLLQIPNTEKIILHSEQLNMYCLMGKILNLNRLLLFYVLSLWYSSVNEGKKTRREPLSELPI